jgi:hypothetical protein
MKSPTHGRFNYSQPAHNFRQGFGLGFKSRERKSCDFRKLRRGTTAALNYLPVRAFCREVGFLSAMRRLDKMRVKERLPGSGSPVIRYARTAP